MSLMIDIGGGTTDISFFTIEDNKPQVYDFYSINKGLNYLTGANDVIHHNKKLIMKRLILLFAFCGMLATAMADWTYGSARFTGNQPSSCLNHGSVLIWYNGSLTQKGISGGEEIWE